MILHLGNIAVTSVSHLRACYKWCWWACSQEGMIDVKSRRCAAEGCNKYPAFNLPGENTARFCGDHRQPGMIDVHNKRCAFEGCQKRPTFNYVGELPSLFALL